MYLQFASAAHHCICLISAYVTCLKLHYSEFTKIQYPAAETYAEDNEKLTCTHSREALELSTLLTGVT